MHSTPHSPEGISPKPSNINPKPSSLMISYASEPGNHESECHSPACATWPANFSFWGVKSSGVQGLGFEDLGLRGWSSGFCKGLGD